MAREALHDTSVKQAAMQPAVSRQISRSYSPQVTVQTKLAVGASDDLYEKEADSVADKVMRMPGDTFAQRKCAECEKEEREKIHRKPLSGNITPFIQRRSGGSSVQVSDGLSQQIQSSRGAGAALDKETGSFMSGRFGTDFSGVNIHTGSQAAKFNTQLNAKAFTVGNDIFFNSGQYQPDTSEGKHLLAHELAHVVQQSGDKGIQRQAAGPVASPAVAASNSVINMVNMFRSEHILFDGWNNDCRDNNKNGRTDGNDGSEAGATDGAHNSHTYPGFSVPAHERCLGSEGGYVELTAPFTTMQEVKYRVCADIISKAYHDAGIPLSLTRRVRDIVHFFENDPHCSFWQLSAFPGPYLTGDFICSYSPREGHGHAGMVMRGCPLTEVPLVMHLPGPSQRIARRTYDPRRTNDLTLEQWPVDIRAIYGIGRYNG